MTYTTTVFSYHWNSRYWAPVAVPAALTGLNSAATTDGAGGFWAVQGTPEPVGGGLYNPRLIHYNNGHWTFDTLPAITGARSGGGVAPPFPIVLRHIPGTTSMWAIVDYSSDPSGAGRTVIMRYTP